MGAQPCIDRIGTVLIDKISMAFLHMSLPLQHLPFPPEILLGIPAEYLDVKGPFHRQHLVLEIIEHQSDGAA